MPKYNIKGDGIIIGDNNVQAIHKTTSDVNKDLVALVTKLAANKEEEKELENDLIVVQDENQTLAKKTSSAGRIAKWLKTAAGEAGMVMLQRMMESGLDWAQRIAATAHLIS